MGLEHLFGSATRLKILRLLIAESGAALYVRELARQIGTNMNAVRRELENLRRLGVLRVRDGVDRADPKRKYYEANPDCALLPELRALVAKADLALHAPLAERVQELGPVQYLALTGQFMGTKDAATDLLVVGMLNRERLARLVRELERELDKPLRYTVFTPKEFKYRRDVTDKFLYSILDGEKAVLIDRVTNTM